MAIGGVNNNKLGGIGRDQNNLGMNDPMKAMEKLMKDIMGLLQQQKQAQQGGGAQGGPQGGGGAQGPQQAQGGQQAGQSQGGSAFGPDELAQELEKQLKKLKEMAAQNPAALAQLLQANPAMAGLLQQGLTPSAGSGVSMGTPAISGGGMK